MEFIVKITKQAEVSIQANTADEAEQIARDMEADGSFPLDLEVSVTPAKLGTFAWSQWLRKLDDQGVSIYSVGALYGFTGCESDSFESQEEAITEAALQYGLI